MDCHVLQKFGKEFNALTRRIEMLDNIIPEVAKNGGILTQSLESLQDNVLNIKVMPEVILPYLITELNENKITLESYEVKMRKIIEIISQEGV